MKIATFEKYVLAIAMVQSTPKKLIIVEVTILILLKIEGLSNLQLSFFACSPLDQFHIFFPRDKAGNKTVN